MSKKTKKLPDKLSDLLELAVKDAKKIGKDPRYELDMSNNWHMYIEDEKKCRVCLAGSVMACTLNVNPTETVYSYDFSLDTSDKLEALDRLRTGDLFFDLLSEEDEPHLFWKKDLKPQFDVKLVKKAKNLINRSFDSAKGRASWDAYLKAAKLLRKAGL